MEGKVLFIIRTSQVSLYNTNETSSVDIYRMNDELYLFKRKDKKSRWVD